MLRIYLNILSLVFACSVFAVCDELPVIAVQPLGRCPKADIEAIAGGIKGLYAVEVRVLPAVELPRNAYYQPRKRYRAEKLLDYLDLNCLKDSYRVIGYCTADISTTKGSYKDWGIFGLGTIGGGSCVVSGFRLRRGGASRTLYLGRLVKVANHELGHTFGLDHCPTTGCLMEDAGGTIKTVDRENGALCPKCATTIKTMLK